MAMQSVNQSIPESGGGGMLSGLTKNPLMLAAIIGGGIGLFVLMTRRSGAGASSSDATVGNVQIASLQDQLLRFSGEESLRDRAMQDLIANGFAATNENIQATYQYLLGTILDSDEATNRQIFMSYLQNSARQEQLHGGTGQGFLDMIAYYTELWESNDGSNWRTWLAPKAEGGSTDYALTNVT